MYALLWVFESQQGSLLSIFFNKCLSHIEFLCSTLVHITVEVVLLSQMP